MFVTFHRSKSENQVLQLIVAQSVTHTKSRKTFTISTRCSNSYTTWGYYLCRELQESRHFHSWICRDGAANEPNVERPCRCVPDATRAACVATFIRHPRDERWHHKSCRVNRRQSAPMIDLRRPIFGWYLYITRATKLALQARISGYPISSSREISQHIILTLSLYWYPRTPKKFGQVDLFVFGDPTMETEPPDLRWECYPTGAIFMGSSLSITTSVSALASLSGWGRKEHIAQLSEPSTHSITQAKSEDIDRDVYIQPYVILWFVNKCNEYQPCFEFIDNMFFIMVQPQFITSFYRRLEDFLWYVSKGA